MYIDTHFHILAMKERGIDVDSLLDKMFKNEFYGGIDIAVDEDDIIKRIPYHKKYPEIKLSIGIGPWGLVNKKTPLMLENINKLQLLYKDCISFVGEIGLDNHYPEYGSKRDQEDLFISQIEFANSNKLPIIVHSREAIEQTTNIIKTNKANKGGIIHCFSASELLLKSALDNNYFISIAGPVTYKNSKNLRSILHYIPLDRLLVETDSPYLPPEPLRGTANTPENVKFVYSTIANELKIEIEELEGIIIKNYTSLLSR